MNELAKALKEMSQGICKIAKAFETITLALDQSKAAQTFNKNQAVKPKIEQNKLPNPRSKVKPKKLKSSKNRKTQFGNRKIFITKKPFLQKTPLKQKPGITETVLNVISQSKRGINTSEIIFKTKLEKRAVQNAVFKLRNEGKINSIMRGVYVATK